MKLKMIFGYLFVLSAYALAETEPLELRGIFNYNESTLFSLKCTHSGRSEWVTLGQSIFGGTLVDYKPESQQIMFRREGEVHRITLPDFSSSMASIVYDSGLSDEALANHNVNALPYSDLPVGISRMEPIDLLDFLVREGYEIPQKVVIQARAEAINEAIRDEGISSDHASEIVANEPSQWRPRTPTHTTSLTRDEKIAKKIIGFSE